MWEDPIVAEVHQIRKELAAKFNYDIKAIFADLRERQAALPNLVMPPKKRDEAAADAEQARNSDSPGSAPSAAAPAA